MAYTTEELKTAKFQLNSTRHKLKQVIITLEAKEDHQRYKSQITLALRRIKAIDIAVSLIDEKLNEKG